MSGRHLPADAAIVIAAGMRAAENGMIVAGTPVDELMERAGLAIAREVRRFAVGRSVLLLAGPGNNGGDAYAAARHLAGWGLDAVVAAHGPAGEGAAARMAALWRGQTVPLAEAPPRAVLVDGLFGTGASRPLASKLIAAVARLRVGASLTLAIDLPSGVPADGDRQDASLSADLTVALGALKVAHVAGPHAAACGHVLLANIGVPVATDWRTAAVPRFEPLPAETQKFARGMVLVVGGAMAGASLLASTAAMHGGAGYVVLAAERGGGVEPHALVRRPVADPAALGALLDDDRIGAAVVGPGLGRDEHARALLDAVLASERDLVIDADALSLLGRSVGERIGADRRRVFLTPHSGEFDRLFGPGGGNKIERTVAAARASGAVVVHKGAATVIAAPDGQVRVGGGATPWLSTAGTGDVLAGLVAARHAADRSDPLRSAVEAVWLHSRAAASLPAGFIADDLVARLAPTLAASR